MSLPDRHGSFGRTSIYLALAPLTVLVAAAGCAKVAGTAAQADSGLGAAGSGDDGALGGAGGSTDDAGQPFSFDAPPTSVCGNGIVEFGESCDDGNTASGDGCSSSCALEPHY